MVISPVPLRLEKLSFCIKNNLISCCIISPFNLPKLGLGFHIANIDKDYVLFPYLSAKGIDERDIFMDKESGGDFNRESYQLNKRTTGVLNFINDLRQTKRIKKTKGVHILSCLICVLLYFSYDISYRKSKTCINMITAVPNIGTSFSSKSPVDVEMNGSSGSFAGEARRLMNRSHLLGFIGNSGIST